MNLKTLLTSELNNNSTAADVGLLVLRLAFGLSLAFGHGLGKFPPSDKFVEAVATMGFPLPVFFAWLSMLAELAGGFLLAIGLFTRPASFFIVFNFAVAFFIKHSADPFQTKEKALLFGAVGLAFLLLGSGKYSLDAMLRGK